MERKTKMLKRLLAIFSRKPPEPKKGYLCGTILFRSGELKLQAQSSDESLRMDESQQPEPFYLTLPTSVTEQSYWKPLDMKAMFTKAWHFVTMRKSRRQENR
jgi:hypothetical protein